MTTAGRKPVHEDTSYFSLLTFNCFGGLLWNPRRRLLTLAQELEHGAPEVVCLQEVQTNLALRLLLRACAGHPHHAYAPGSRAPASALLTLARIPLDGTRFVRYATQGAWYALTLMDRLTQKGALVSELWRAGVQVFVINTHLLANYWADWRPACRAACDQQRQLHQLAALVQALPPEALVLVAGDFNLPRGSWLYDEFLTRSGLHDPLAGDLRPTYRPFPGVPARYALPIDFIFIRCPPALGVQIQSDLCFAERLPLVSGGQDYLSDHLGVRVTLRWTQAD